VDSRSVTALVGKLAPPSETNVVVVVRPASAVLITLPR